MSPFRILTNVNDPQYGIIVDAGSSHSGLILYKWSGEKKHCTGLVEQIHDCTADGGLAKIDPSNISSYFDPCFNDLSRYIDSKKPTPVFMGATAGMRLLNLTSPDVVNQLFESFATYIKNSSYKYDLKQASIISGSDEGLFSWVTANHLSGKLLPTGTVSPETCAMLDMGGASAQIAYEVNASISNTSISNTSVSSSDLTTVRLYGVNHTVKSSSNLCFGVDQARFRLFVMLRLISGPKKAIITNPCAPKGSLVNVSRSELDENKCVETKDGFSFQEDYYSFVGSSNPSECRELVQQILDPVHCEQNFFRCPEREETSAIDSTSIVALSSYFYTSNILNLDRSGSIFKEDFIKQSDEYCSLDLNQALKWKNVTGKYADVYCFQLKYIEATLTQTYKLTTNWSNVVFKKNIGSASLGWSLGLMINATNAIPSEAITETIIGSVSFSFMTISCFGILCLAGYFFYKMRNRSRHEPLQYGTA